MHRLSWKPVGIGSLLVVALLAAGPALAEKPSWAGNEKGPSQRPGNQVQVQDGRYFNDQHRLAIQEHFAGQYRRGHCPPGLAKKHNGCMPPGQAKKWTIGRPLPRDVIFHDLPPAVLERLGPPPSRHRFVRVAQDVLLIARATGMVIDAIENLSWEFNR